MEFTGERFVPGLGSSIEVEHFHRYLIASFLVQKLKVLDIACGEGYGSNLLAKVAETVVGIDQNDDVIEEAKKSYSFSNINFLHGFCEKICTQDSCFDVVVSFETIEHHDKHDEMLSEIKRVLKPDGFLLISSPNRPEYAKFIDKPNPYHVKELDFDEFSTLIGKYFKNVRYYAQRIMSGSCCVPHDASEAGPMLFLDLSSDSRTTRIEHPVFFLALAGDGELPELPCTFLDGMGSLPRCTTSRFVHSHLYVSEVDGSGARPYSEDRGDDAVSSLDGVRKELRLNFPGDLAPISSIRLDLADVPCVIDLHGLSIEDAQGTEIWRWSGHATEFASSSGQLWYDRSHDGLTCLCLNEDPQFELSLDSEIASRIGPGASLRVVMTPKPLGESLADLVALLAGQKGAPVAATPDSGPLAPRMQALASLVRETITSRDRLLDEKRRHIEMLEVRQRMLQEEVARAEGQLDLLKELIRSEGGTGAF